MSSHISQTFLPNKTPKLKASILPDGRWLLYNAAEQSATTLTASGGILWELCDGHTPVSDLIEQIQELYTDVPAARLETETLDALRDFMEQGLVTDNAIPIP